MRLFTVCEKKILSGIYKIIGWYQTWDYSEMTYGKREYSEAYNEWNKNFRMPWLNQHLNDKLYMDQEHTQTFEHFLAETRGFIK